MAVSYRLHIVDSLQCFGQQLLCLCKQYAGSFYASRDLCLALFELVCMLAFVMQTLLG